MGKADKAGELRKWYALRVILLANFLIMPPIILLWIVPLLLAPAEWTQWSYRPVTATVLEHGSPRHRARSVRLGYRVDGRDYSRWATLWGRSRGYPSWVEVGRQVTAYYPPHDPGADLVLEKALPWGGLIVSVVFGLQFAVGLVLLYFTPQDHYASLAKHHLDHGRYRQARDLARKGVAWARRPLARRLRPGALSASLSQVAVCAIHLGDQAEAREALREGRPLVRKPRLFLVRLAQLLGGEKTDPNYARALTNQAGLLADSGDFAAALALHEEARALRESVLGTDHPDYATSVHNLGIVHLKMGDYAGAEPLLRQALAILKPHIDEHRLSYVKYLNNVAGLCHARGNYAEADQLFMEALAVLRAAPDEHAPRQAEVLGNLANLRKQMGNYAEADSLYQQSLAIRRAALGPGSPAYADGLNNLATLRIVLHDWATAKPLLREALAVYRASLGDRHPSCARTLANLATVADQLGERTEAEQLLRQALNVWREAVGDRHPGYAGALAGLANLYRRLGRWAEAEPLYRQVLDVRRATLGERHPDYAGTLNNLAYLYQLMGDNAAAEPMQRQAAEILRAACGEDHPDGAVFERNLGVLAACGGRLDEALTHMRRAAAIDDRTRGVAFSIGSESQRLAYLAGVQARFHTFVSLVAGHLAGSPEAVQAAFDLVLRRKGLAAEALAVQREVVLGNRHPALRSSFEELVSLRRRIAARTLAGPQAEDVAAYQEVLAHWNAERERLEAELARAVPKLNLQPRLQDVTRHAVARALPAGSALVEFVRFGVYDFGAGPRRPEIERRPSAYLAFVLPAGEPDSVRLFDLGDADVIDRLIADFRVGVTGEAERGADRDLRLQVDAPDRAADAAGGEELRAAVFDRLAAAVGAASRLLLAPDGDLTRLPFEVLPGADGRHLIDEYQISYLGCGRDLLRLAGSSAGQPSEPVVVADPDFDLGSAVRAAVEQGPLVAGRHARDLTDRDLTFARLPGTRHEGAQLGDLLGVRAWLDAAVVEARLKRVRSPRILHLATHGFFLSDQHRDTQQEHGWVVGEELGRLGGLHLENPLLRSGLALAGANTWLHRGQLPAEAEDGLLTAEDVTGMDLSATELVVLSACQTGLGEVHVGEGVFGLRRAFVLAGARTLVMSLWKVPDLLTQELMTDFYRRLLSGEGRAEALRQAQLALKERHPDPSFWGAFVCLGDPGPLPLRTG